MVKDGEDTHGFKATLKKFGLTFQDDEIVT